MSARLSSSSLTRINAEQAQDVGRKRRVEVVRHPALPLPPPRHPQVLGVHGRQRHQPGLGLPGFGDGDLLTLRGPVHQIGEVGLGVIQTHRLPHQPRSGLSLLGHGTVSRYEENVPRLTKLVKARGLGAVHLVPARRRSTFPLRACDSRAGNHVLAGVGRAGTTPWQDFRGEVGRCARRIGHDYECARRRRGEPADERHVQRAA